DDLTTLRREGLAFFHYRAVPGAEPVSHTQDIERLIEAGALLATPMTYEDFLPVSAAGIFQSNLGDDARSSADSTEASQGSQACFEEALGTKVSDEIALYERQQKDSLAQALAALTLQ